MHNIVLTCISNKHTNAIFVNGAPQAEDNDFIDVKEQAKCI